MSKKKYKYTKENIKILNWYEAIRVRPGMYVGHLNLRGFTELLKTIFTITFENTQSNWVVLTLKNKREGQISFRELKAPIKDTCATWKAGERMNFREVELQVLNAMCTHLDLKVLNQAGETIWKQQFEKGILTQGEEVVGKAIEGSSFHIQFELDAEIWGADFEWNTDYLTTNIRDFAFLQKNRKFELLYSVGTEACRLIYQFKNGLQDKLKLEKLNGLGDTYFDMAFEARIANFSLEVAFAFWNYEVEETFLKSYVNDYYTHENGTHVDGLLKGLTYGVMQYFQKHELTETYKISEKGMAAHLIAVLNIRLDAPVFSGCVKNKLANSEIIEPITQYVSDLLFQQMELDADATQKLIRKFEM